MRRDERAILRWSLAAKVWLLVWSGPHFSVVVLDNVRWQCNPLTREEMGK